jgi:predicted enzyme related to lactoylglutathione lyase
MGVIGMGGLFFRADDPDALSAWYIEHLGVGAGCDATGSADENPWVWQTTGGPMVFAPFKRDSDYFAADKAFMINLRVTGLDALLDRLRSAGIEITTKAEWDDPSTGRFARIHDPEGNAIELWEPPAAA